MLEVPAVAFINAINVHVHDIRILIQITLQSIIYLFFSAYASPFHVKSNATIFCNFYNWGNYICFSVLL